MMRCHCIKDEPDPTYQPIDVGRQQIQDRFGEFFSNKEIDIQLSNHCFNYEKTIKCLEIRHEQDIDIVCHQTGVDRQRAIDALKLHKSDIVGAILSIEF